MRKSKFYSVAKLKDLLHQLGWRRSQERAAVDGHTCCGTLAVYAGSLTIRSDLLAELGAEPGTEHTLQELSRSIPNDRDSAN